MIFVHDLISDNTNGAIAAIRQLLRVHIHSLGALNALFERPLVHGQA